MSASSGALHRKPSARPMSALFDGSSSTGSGGGHGSAGESQTNVCIDCKDMILQIIKAQRATRRKQFTQSLCLR